MNGTELANAGTSKVARNNDEWMAEAYMELARRGASGEEFTSDDVRISLSTPPNPNCLGAAFRVLSRDGFIRRVGYRPATTPSAHARALSVWRGK
jgi:hypothetical protein